MHKNELIDELESELKKLKAAKDQPNFEDIFDLQVGNGVKNSGSSDINFDEILLYEDVINEDRRRSQELKETKTSSSCEDFDSGPPSEDPIMAFVLSEEEQEAGEVVVNKADKISKSESANNIELVLNQDIVVHAQPSNGKIRPILKETFSQTKSSTGSQTHITAIRNGGNNRNWVSEPQLSHKLESSSNNDKISRHKSIVTFEEPLPVRRSTGRYSILNRDFSQNKNATTDALNPTDAFAYVHNLPNSRVEEIASREENKTSRNTFQS